MRLASLANAFRALAFLLFVILLAWAPLPFGSNQLLAGDILAGSGAALLLLWSVAQLVSPDRVRVPWMVTLAAALFLGVAAWAWVQAQPWLVGYYPWLEPHPIWRTADELGLDPTPLVAADGARALQALEWLLGYGCIFALAFLLTQDKERARRLLYILIAIVALYAVYGLAMFGMGMNAVLWLDKGADTSSVTSTFVNRNNFGTYAGLGVLLCLALILEELLGVRSIEDTRRVTAELIQRLIGKRSPLLLALIILTTALLLSGSRGAFLGTVAAIVTFVALTFLILKPSLKGGLLLLVGVVGLGWGAIAMSGHATLSRFERADSELSTEVGGRGAIWDLSFEMIEDRPWIGHGYGSYEPMFLLYRDKRFSTFMVDKAHNTYLEHLVELGIPATVALYAAPLLLFVLCLKGIFIRRRDKIFPLVGVAATVLVGVHALVDFSLQIPAVAVTYAAILGLGCAQSMRSLRRPIVKPTSRDAETDDDEVRPVKEPVLAAG